MLTAIIQARMGSNRLPGKVMKEIEGKPLLFYVIKQTLSAKFINRVIISTSIAPEDKKIVDAVGRSLTNRKPKWYRYGNSGYPFITGKSDTAIVVEDVVSALTISKYCTGIALLGTNLLQTHIDVLKNYKKVGIALDKDASKKAVKILDDLALSMNVKFLLLEDDIKEMMDEDVEKLVNKVDRKAWGWQNDTY